MSDYSSYVIREIDLKGREKNKLAAFLGKNGLRLEKLDYAAAVFDEYDEDENILACGGHEGATVKCVAVSPEMRGEGLMDKIVSHLLNRLLGMGYPNVFVFTKPENEKQFVSQGFGLVGKAEKAIFLERGHPGAGDFSDSLKKYYRKGKNGCIVMNANPFTKGHRYLVEEASKQVDNLYIFVVETDRSDFPFRVRKKLVEEGVADIKNATVLSGGPYIISDSVFPSYFLKELSDVTPTHAELDVSVFGRVIVPPLGISVRFVGSEENDGVTRIYNETMIRGLGIETRVIERKKIGDRPISASELRKALASGDLEKAKKLVPDTTYRFLISDEGKEIRSKIKAKAQQI